MYIAVRVRGGKGISPDIRKTLHLLRLHKANHAVLVRNEQLPMLRKVQGHVTWGSLDEKVLEKLLKKRGRISGNKRIDEKFLHGKNFKNFSALAKAILEGRVKLQEIGIKPVFRLSPPRKGYERQGIKKGYSAGGALGDRAADINKLVGRMLRC